MQILSAGNFVAIDFFSNAAEKALAFEILDCSDYCSDCSDCGDSSSGTCFSYC